MEFMTKQDEEKTGDSGAGCLTELADIERGLSITVVLLYLVHFTSPGSELMSCPGCVYI